MAITHLSLVNQKLVYASTLITMATAHGEPASTTQRLELQALMDSAVLHLALAYGFYLRELGENYHIKGLSHISQAGQLAAALAETNKSPSEAQELIDLEQNAQSWLSQMLVASTTLHCSPVPPKPQKAFPIDGLINILDVSDTPETSPSVNPSALGTWLAEFRTLVLRQRETSAEY
jgi:hypothetical protein